MATRRLAQTFMAVGVTELDGARFKFDTTTKRKRAEPRDSPATVSPALRAGGRALRARGAGCAYSVARQTPLPVLVAGRNPADRDVDVLVTRAGDLALEIAAGLSVCLSVWAVRDVSTPIVGSAL